MIQGVAGAADGGRAGPGSGHPAGSACRGLFAGERAGATQRGILMARLRAAVTIGGAAD